MLWSHREDGCGIKYTFIHLLTLPGFVSPKYISHLSENILGPVGYHDYLLDIRISFVIHRPMWMTQTPVSNSPSRCRDRTKWNKVLLKWYLCGFGQWIYFEASSAALIQMRCGCLRPWRVIEMTAFENFVWCSWCSCLNLVRILLSLSEPSIWLITYGATGNLHM